MSISGLLDLSRRSLGVSTQAIRTIGDNVANVNTPGYSRRRAQIVTTTTMEVGSARVGTGVEIARIEQTVDKFINSELISRIGDRSMAEIREEFLGRAEAPFALDNQPGSLGYELNNFFNSLEDLKTSPADIALRTQVMEAGQKLADAIRQGYKQMSQLQREADNRVGILVEDVNRLTSAIASLNEQISKSEAVSTNQEALTLRDRREQLMEELGELVSFESVENNNGQMMLYLNNGFALVSGSKSNDLQFTATPGFGPVGGYPPGLDQSSLGFVVYEYSGGGQIDLTEVFRSGSGEIAGLLSLRGVQPNNAAANTFDCDGDLVHLASYLESISRDLLVRFNLEYLGPDENAGLVGYQASSRDLDNNAPLPFGLFSFDGATAGNNYGDVDGDGRPEAADINALVASGITNFASVLSFNVSSERAFAAARDLDSTAGVVKIASGDASNIEGLLAQRSVVQTYTLGGLGTPAFSQKSNMEGMYDLVTSTVGALSSRAAGEYKISKDRETQLKELQANVSGVNLDEEFAKLINYQRGFEASARMIRIADELFTSIVQIGS